jgi:hypothetical protein
MAGLGDYANNQLEVLHVRLPAGPSPMQSDLLGSLESEVSLCLRSDKTLFFRRATRVRKKDRIAGLETLKRRGLMYRQVEYQQCKEEPSPQSVEEQVS